jgi:hypothetical protein
VAAPAFVAVEVAAEPAQTATASASALAEIHVAGKVLVISPDFDERALQRLLAVLEDRP